MANSSTQRRRQDAAAQASQPQLPHHLPPRHQLRRAGIAVAAALVLGVGVAGCANNDPLAQQFSDGSTKNYIAGDGTVVEIPPENRGDSIGFAGIDEHGNPVASTDYAGRILVVNFWYAECPPCRLEAPDLEALNQQYQDQGVAFLGVNVRDEADTARAFATQFGITYPSIIDTVDSGVQLAFAGKIAPNAVPSTIILDTEGRLAARVTGLAEKSVLNALISTVLETTP
ncbi:TlpA family protein disulfide reductase [Clavibacter phaseoli]|jgi:thiol-disulfide isomerase/thioredoxin|uniref:TlpA family protein disulfide reductase n=1 Tax=Clavibacter phaseoli TaxID=1734031 RepID=A0A8I0VAM1_9MICO|nr:TlpA disulfide reductase family protein [Clavibacter phaseoli]MBF4632643.1 TlpA family protein disulfide reductase [Clavibacter phaseoli]UKF32420.1 TlpA family protein disulfide reductase [Clavibacter phaseoli]UKF38462.1 TlpA family protein disulfide reductase [Clavibacter phaseoli]